MILSCLASSTRSTSPNSTSSLPGSEKLALNANPLSASSSAAPYYTSDTVSPEGVAPEARKHDALRHWPLPKTGTDMLSYLGFWNYYRALIRHFAELAVPLYPFGQAAQIDWTPELEHAFDALRQALINAAILRLPDPSSLKPMHPP